jgi:hypothetical protein
MQPEREEAPGLPPQGLKDESDDLQSFDTKPEFDPQANYALALDQFDWGHPNELQTQWLVSRGVGLEALLKPWPVGATRVSFNGDWFDPDPHAPRRL